MSPDYPSTDLDSAPGDASDISHGCDISRLFILPGPSHASNGSQHKQTEHILLGNISSVPQSYREDVMPSELWSAQEETVQGEGSLRRTVTPGQNQANRSQYKNSQYQPDINSAAVTILSSSKKEVLDDGGQATAQKSFVWQDKLGTFAMAVLFIGLILLWAAIGILVFIWFGNPDIPAWRQIITRNWLSKAVAICIGVIQQVMALQLGIAVAMVASLALESRDVVLSDIATVSMMRATAGGPDAFILLWQHLSRGWSAGVRHSNNFIQIVLLSILWGLSQFLVLILLTDVSSQPTTGLVSMAVQPYNLHYNVSQNTAVMETRVIQSSSGPWSRKVSDYIPFAEYSEPPYTAPGVSDTGVTLRSFLPFKTTQERENLEHYFGHATTLDARVTCQVPKIENSTIDHDGIFRGFVAASKWIPRFNSHSDQDTLTSSIDGINSNPLEFSCILPVYSATLSSEWRLSICQLVIRNTFGGLVSEFKDVYSEPGWDYFDPDLQYGTAYLILNATDGAWVDWPYVLSLQPNYTSPVHYPIASQERGEWLDLLFYEGHMTLSVSLCFAPFDFADIPVRITSRSNRTESELQPDFDLDTSTYTFSGFRRAMGQDRELAPDQRGILALENQSWRATPQENYAAGAYEYKLHWYLRSFANLGYGYNSSSIDGDTTGTNVKASGMLGSYDGNCDFFTSTAATCASIERMHVWLVQEILRTGGSIAFALQTMITLLSSMTYYEQMGQFDKWTLAEQAFFEVFQVPHSFVGFTIVTIIVSAHGILSRIKAHYYNALL